MKKTVSSVLKQTWRDFEFIVIDGGSTDGSVEYLESNDKTISHWISEPDDGVYQAMNKGIQKATGEYLLFLNSGDHFYSNSVLEEIHENLENESIIYSNLNVIEDGKSFTKDYPETLSFSYFVKDTLPHPATFIKKEALENLGMYDEKFKIAADWKFFIDAICKHDLSYKKINTVISTFYIGGMSSNPENRSIKKNEIQGTLKREYKAYYQDVEDYVMNNRILTNLRNSRIIKYLVRLGFLNKF